MRTLFITQELVPYHATGGMAVVSRDLPAALAERSLPHTQLLPFIKNVTALPDDGALEVLAQASVKIDGKHYAYQLCTVPTSDPQQQTLFVAQDEIFRDRIYDDAVRLHRNIVIGHAALNYLASATEPYRIVHALDQLSTLTLAYIKAQTDRYRLLFNILSAEYDFSLGKLIAETEFDGKDALCAACPTLSSDSAIELGLRIADQSVTSSPAYAAMLAERYAGALAGRPASALHGIEHGIDINTWNPAALGHGYRPMATASLADDKAHNRDILMAALAAHRSGTAAVEAVPQRRILSFIGRFCKAKGRTALYALIDALADFPDVELLFIVPAAAVSEVDREKLQRRAATTPRFTFVNDYQQDFAEVAFAGSDFIIMPSEQEPSGLCQKIAMRFGSIPVVTPAGGLKDTIIDAFAHPATGNGFVAESIDPASYLALLGRVLALDPTDPLIADVQRNALNTDVSLARTADDYAILYRGLLATGAQ